MLTALDTRFHKPNSRRRVRRVDSPQLILIEEETSMFKVMLKSSYDKMVELQVCLERALNKKDKEFTVIHLSPHEMQSRLTRVRGAEGLIAQLPKTHDGRNTWLMNYGIGVEALQIREKHEDRDLVWNDKTQCLDSVRR